MLKCRIGITLVRLHTFHLNFKLYVQLTQNLQMYPNMLCAAPDEKNPIIRGSGCRVIEYSIEKKEK